MLKIRIFRSVLLHSVSSPPYYNTDRPQSLQDPRVRTIFLHVMDFYSYVIERLPSVERVFSFCQTIASYSNCAYF
jgi:hypothetical protein